MQICQIERNFVTACAFCDLLIFNKITNPRKAAEKLSDQLRAHIDTNPACKAYYDALPTFEDMRGILKRGE